jgi:phospholipid/cholesterol/gamma-HCH transport system ATP-binding protein
VLDFQNVSVSFDEVLALDNVSFSLEPGITAIVFGAAGSGKSVLLKSAIGLVRSSAGRIGLFGQDITHLAEDELFEIRGKVGVLFQEGGLFDSLTIEENVGYPLLNQRVAGQKRTRLNPEEVHQRVREALRFVELEHTLDKFPSELSGGMRRRVGIARAAVTGPPLMLYDSPTAGLDPITANTIIALIIKARDTKNTTSVIVTHRSQDGHLVANYRWNGEKSQLETAAGDSRIHQRTRFMVFREGQLVFKGTEEELDAATDPYVAKFKTGRP